MRRFYLGLPMWRLPTYSLCISDSLVSWGLARLSHVSSVWNARFVVGRVIY